MNLKTPTFPVTAVEYHRLAAEGAFDPDERVELIEGDIVAMTPIGDDHIWTVNCLNLAFALLMIEGRAIPSIQNPIALDNLSEPEPDFALLTPESRQRRATPRPHDVLLLVEVSGATLRYDRERKIPLYGQSGVLESWLVDLNAGTVTAYRKPSAKGYLEQNTFKRGQKLAPEAFPDFEVAVDDMLG
jgi:Uma2 family endonuclease